MNDRDDLHLVTIPAPRMETRGRRKLSGPDAIFTTIRTGFVPISVLVESSGDLDEYVVRER